jgi:hypothetical protein
MDKENEENVMEQYPAIRKKETCHMQHCAKGKKPVTEEHILQGSI